MHQDGDGVIFVNNINHLLVHIVQIAMFALKDMIIIVYGWEHVLGKKILKPFQSSIYPGSSI